MKKPVKKLSLDKFTVSNLTPKAQTEIKGGAWRGIWVTGRMVGPLTSSN